ncbi:ATP-binding protein [Lutibacter sp. Hel_I_33_5]|uniref:sensor histidine kinase n=1 Tax=Lutibacter sp. Hel_I_33_5 TaxID=1566289 RepID=UPI001C962717|nr:ATP-binding protein [Lutibacter sp. Hel_I_33_5]
MLDFKSDTLEIKDVILLYKKGKFTESISEKVFYSLKDQQNSWLHFQIDSLNKDKYLINWNSYLKTGQVFIVTQNIIQELNSNYRYNPLKERKVNFRLPTWKLKKNNKKTNVFIKINDSDRYHSNLKFLLLNTNDFLKFTQEDARYNIAICTFLLILGFIILVLFYIQKQYNLLWYFGYMAFLITDYLIFKGLWFNDLLSNDPFLFHNLKTLVQTSLVLFAAFFFMNLYPFERKNSFSKNLFKTAAFTSFIIILLLILKWVIDDVQFNLYWYWIPVRISAILIFIAHFILIFKKIIPFYLGISFLLTILFAIVHLFINPNPKISLNSALLLVNFSYVLMVLETLLITYYVISEIVKEKMLAINLRQENLNLRNSFQENLLKSQHLERNKLVNNVHDSFGGYLEALKLRLLNKSKNTPEKVQEILDSFYKEYRYLLYSLYSPKINSENFIENLNEFCYKFNQLTNNRIQNNFDIKNIELSSEKCVHFYRIISELTTNAIKYSKASKIIIEINNNENYFYLVVKDDGIGFDKKLIKKNSLGIKSIENRVLQMNGKINIDSKINKGTFIKISIPI